MLNISPVEALQLLEWSKFIKVGEDEIASCPVCESPQADGHKKGCWLAITLADASTAAEELFAGIKGVSERMAREIAEKIRGPQG
ncbi:hypothetical protein LCGC14_0723200 [marine sediment metagenome]|uniref:Uncharacterized protein n=1 Tax=marine sediment metagenome TaxID=412755 RepID=A0A0F9QFZ4_9ZZZZ